MLYEVITAEKFADSLETIPLTLSENAGMDPIDTLTILRSRQMKGEKWTGIDVMKAKIANMKSGDIIEPLSVKLQIVSSAAEVACMILVITSYSIHYTKLYESESNSII